MHDNWFDQHPGRGLLVVFALMAALLYTCFTALAQQPAQRPPITVYEFQAAWCHACQGIGPLVVKLQREGLPLLTVDIDVAQNKPITARMRIGKIPAFVAIDNATGREVDRFADEEFARLSASKAAIEGRVRGMFRKR